MRKPKGQTVDLLYTSKEEKAKKVKNKSKNTKEKKNNKTNKTVPTKQRINLDNEIIIGLTPKKEVPKSKTKNKKQIKKTRKSALPKNKTTNKARKKQNYKNKSIKNKNYQKINKNKKSKRKIKFIKWMILLIFLILMIALFMLSAVFNIKKIEVINNNKVSSEEIINLSTLTYGVNMFKISNKKIINGVKTNAYIENVKVKRSINGTVTLDIEERKPTFMLKFANTYVYINNQGYMLELSEKSLEIPILAGYTTPNEEIKAGNRLNIEDLNKLDDVIKIIEASKNSPLANKITKINISDSNDYKLTVSSEKKTVRIGEMTNVNIKLQMAGQVFKAEKGKKGEIYFQEDGKKAIFKEEV